MATFAVENVGLLAEDLLAFALKFALEGLKNSKDGFAEIGSVLFEPSGSGFVVRDAFKLVHLGVRKLGADALADTNLEFLFGVRHESAFLVLWHIGEADFVHEVIVNPHIPPCIVYIIAQEERE